jgi:hypothetical protein
LKGGNALPFQKDTILAMSLECSQCLAIIPSQNVPPAAPTKPKMENHQKLYKRSDAMSICRSISDCKFVKGYLSIT